MEIKTKRLTVRPIQAGDEKEIHEYAGVCDPPGRKDHRRMRL